jgi:hypothetical protein
MLVGVISLGAGAHGGSGMRDSRSPDSQTVAMSADPNVGRAPGGFTTPWFAPAVKFSVPSAPW